MGIVDETVEDSVGSGGITDLFVPTGNRQLRSQDCRTGLIPVFTDFPEVAAFGFGERSHRPVIDHQYLDAAQAQQQTAEAAIRACDGKIAE